MPIYKTIEIRYTINKYPQYGFGEDKQLYNIHTGRVKKQVLNGGSIGYWIGKRFITLKALRPMLNKVEKSQSPF